MERQQRNAGANGSATHWIALGKYKPTYYELIAAGRPGGL